MTLASTVPSEPPSSQLSVVSTIEPMRIEVCAPARLLRVHITYNPGKSIPDVVALPGPPRQHGCPQYEALSAREKIEVCLSSILKPIVALLCCIYYNSINSIF